jgi:hypothetical protein
MCTDLFGCDVWRTPGVAGLRQCNHNLLGCEQPTFRRVVDAQGPRRQRLQIILLGHRIDLDPDELQPVLVLEIVQTYSSMEADDGDSILLLLLVRQLSRPLAIAATASLLICSCLASTLAASSTERPSSVRHA